MQTRGSVLHPAFAPGGTIGAAQPQERPAGRSIVPRRQELGGRRPTVESAQSPGRRDSQLAMRTSAGARGRSPTNVSDAGCDRRYVRAMRRFRLSTFLGAVTLASISLGLVRVFARYPVFREPIGWYAPAVLAILAAIWGARSYRGQRSWAGLIAGMSWGGLAAAFLMGLLMHSIVWGLTDSRDWYVVHISWVTRWQFMRWVFWQGLLGAFLGAMASLLLSIRWLRPRDRRATH